MNKAAVKRRLVFMASTLDPIVLVDDTDPVQVAARYTFKGDDAGDTCILFGVAEPPAGDAAPSGISTSKPSDDVFTVNGTVVTEGYEDAAAAEEAAERIFNAFDTRLSAWQRLVDPDNPETPGSLPDYWVESAYVTTSSLLSGKDDGGTWSAAYSFAVQCTTHLR